jgi:PPOX class probable F420-dependent enzyme
MSRRDQIKLSDEEVWAFLADQRVVVCATVGRDGWPHLMPLWYVIRGRELWSWTYAASQKTKNLQRDPRATLQVEAGEAYQELRGVMFKCDVTIHEDTEDVAALGREIYTRYSGGAGDLDPEVTAMVERQALKRVGLQFTERARATWDHSKLASGVY